MQRNRSICVKFFAWIACPLAMMLGLSGCTTERRGVSSQPSTTIDNLVMLSAPAAVNVEPSPGSDAIALRIYAMSQNRPKGVAVTQGMLQVLMFDGVITDQTPETIKPLKVWDRTPAELKLSASKSNTLGISYVLTLPWGEARPHNENITIIARFISSDGRTIYSAPSTIPVGDHPALRKESQ